MKAKDNSVKHEVLIQYDGLESNLAEIYERVKNTYVAAGHDIETFKEFKLYTQKGFTRYAKVQCSCEIFHKLKWYKAKK